MKITLITLLLFSGASLTRAQEYKINVPNAKENRLVLKGFTGNLPVEGYSGNEIIFSSDAEELEIPEKAKGLKPIYPGGTDNTGVGLSVEKTENQITVTCLLPMTRKGDYKIKVPDNLTIEIESDCVRTDDISVENMKGEIDIKCCHDINIKNATGPLVLSTISGDINVVFNSLESDKPFSINSVSGDIDVTIPVKAATTLNLNTISGGFYSDFDIPDTQSDLKRVGGNNLTFPINGGGFKFSIVTISGDIYIRKGS